MSDSTLLPEQEELLCGLVEARNRLLPQRESFQCMRDWSEAGDGAILTHPGWPEDAPSVLMRDLYALAAGRYILRIHPGDVWDFELTGKALSLYESLQRMACENAEPEGETSDVPATSSGTEEVTEESVFRKDGEMWTVSYEGTTKYFRDTKGMNCLWVLISNAGEKYGPAQLLDAVEGGKKLSSSSGAAVSRQSLEDIGLSITGFSEAGEVSGDDAVDAVRKRLEELLEEISEVKWRNDTEPLERLFEEKEQCEDYLKKALGGKTRLRWACDDYARIRSRVHQNIIRALKAIESEHPSLHTHLEPAIKTRHFFAYRPDRHMDWCC